MQKIIISGNIGRDAEVTSFGDKQKLVFTVACSEGKDAQKVTTWYDVEYFNTALQPYLSKGRQILVMGRLRVKAYTAKDGTQRIGINVFADSIELMGAPRLTEKPQSQQRPQPAPQPVAQEEDGLPF